MIAVAYHLWEPRLRLPARIRCSVKAPDRVTLKMHAPFLGPTDRTIFGITVLASSPNSVAFAGPTEKITTLALDAKIDSTAKGFERIRSSLVSAM